MKLTALLFLLALISANKSLGQEIIKQPKPAYLSVQSGVTFSTLNSIGTRLFFEYQKDLKGNWQYGIAYDNSRFLFRAATDTRTVKLNLSSMSGNVYYKINAFKDRLFWTAGMGVGVMHVFWDENDKVGPSANASLTLNVRVSKRIYIETSPLIILAPVNRVYYATFQDVERQHLLTLVLFPLGVKIKL